MLVIYSYHESLSIVINFHLENISNIESTFSLGRNINILWIADQLIYLNSNQFDKWLKNKKQPGGFMKKGFSG